MNIFTRSLLILCFAAIGFEALAQEPTQYPTGVTATTQSGTSIQVNWTASAGANLPSHYLVLIRAVPAGSFTTPADGTAVADDTDISDNVGAANITFGTNTVTFSSLTIDTDYEITIYPYKTGGAPTPDFKTSAGNPTATASTKRPTVGSPTATTIDETTATLGGTVTANGGNALIARGTVWKTTAGVTIADNQVAEGGTGVSTFTQARTGLPSGSHIFYAAYATNVAGSSLSSEASFFTLSTVPVNQPTMSVTSVSSSQINLTFTAASANGGSTAGYIILRTSNGANPPTSSVQDGVAPASLNLGVSTLVSVITNTATTTFNDTGLSAGTHYYYAVVPFNWNGTDPQTYNYKVGIGFSTDDDITFSSVSDVILNGGTTANLSYKLFQNTALDPLDDTQSESLAIFQLRDGGAAADADNKSTRLTSLSISISNFANIKRIGLYDNTDLIPGTDTPVTGANVTFDLSSYLLDAADGGTNNFNVRVTYNQAVNDNDNIHITITGATAAATGSGFANATAGGAATSGAVNKIVVTAQRLRFLANPSPVSRNTPFNLTVRATDNGSYFNVDKDYTSKVRLNVDGVPAGSNPAFVLGAAPQDPNLVAGVFTWTGLQINASGTYELEASDDDFGATISDTQLNLTVTSTASNITSVTPAPLCYSSAFTSLGTIVITETDVAGFEAPGGTFQLALPPGFEFDNTVVTGLAVSGGADISAPVQYSYPSANVVQFGFTIGATANINTITIAGLKIRAPFPPGSASPPGISGNITRAGGTATIAGDGSGTSHGSVSAALGTPPAGGVSFTVIKTDPSHVDVLPGETRFSQSANPVRLVGTPAGGVFSASQGVTFIASPAPGEYRFNPQSLSPGMYVVNYTVQNGGCDFIATKTFEVYVTNITNLAAQYCNNAPESGALSVSASYITGRYGAGYTFQKFVFWNTPTFTAVDMPSTTGPVWKFDPKLAMYQPIYSSTATFYGTFGIWIGFTVTNGSFTSTEWSLIPVRPAPTPSFSIPKTEFCSDDLPVTLTGTPPNSNTIGDDFFTAVGQSGSLNAAGSPVVWTFKPNSVTGVSPGTSASFDITYTYRDPATGCSSTSASKEITVSSRPTSVTSAMLTTSVIQNICQGKPVGAFVANGVSGTTYNWYLSDNVTKLGDQNSFTPPNPPVNVLIPGVRNFYVTRSVDGCESNREPSSPSTPLSLTVNVISSPAAPATDRALEYCVNETIPNNDLLITSGIGTVKWYTSYNPNLTNTPVFTGQNGSAANLSISNSSENNYTFYVTQTEPVNSCESPVPTTVTVAIEKLPSLSIEYSVPDLAKICTSGSSITFTGKDDGGPTANGVWSGTGLTSALVSNSSEGTAVLTTTNLAPKNYTLQYNYTNADGCPGNTNVSLTVLPTIVPSIAPLDSCFGVFVRLNNTSTINSGASPTTTTIQKTQWNFSDGSGLALDLSNNTIPVGTNGGRTKGTFFSPEHQFSTTGAFTIQYAMETSDGCRYSSSKQLTINRKPNIDFSWKKACRDGTSATEFKAVEQSSPVIPISAYQWNFHKQGTLTDTGAGTGANPTVNYNKDGRDSVMLIVLSAAQCRDTVQHPVLIVPRFAQLTEDNSYLQGFDGGPAGWIDGGENSSWAVAFPNGPVVKGDASISGLGKAWDTNPTPTGISNNREQSWVLSPCFDFSAVNKPIVSLDIWSDTPVLNDGAVLQYNITGDILNDADWVVIGAPNQGANWYDETGISSSPGNQSVDPSGNDVGWTGSYGGWRKAAFKLDNLAVIPNNTSIVFRVAFASNVPRRDGFAFDNIFIGERTRTVLLENFTNSSAAANTKFQNEAFNDFAGNSAELALLQFHTQFPGADILNEENSAINNARTAFYGITSTGKFALDGEVVEAGALLLKRYEDRILTPAPMKMKVTQTKEGGVVKIKTTLINITNEILPTKNLTAFVAVAEKSITDVNYLGSNNASEFKYVARRMLPDASGTIIMQDIPALGSIDLPEVIWRTPGLLENGEASIVAFVQRTDGDNKNVLQAMITDATVTPDITTGVQIAEDNSGIHVFPNPANESFVIQLPERAKQTYDVSVVDTYGKQALVQSIEKGQQRITTSSRDLPTGMYLIRIQSSSGETHWKKLIVNH